MLRLFSEGSKYNFIKQVSNNKGLPPSTIKYSLKKLEKADIIKYQNGIELTKKGEILVDILEENNEL